ncbi:penicillin-binding protein 1C [Falsiroseomonas selenitidurans]|uniref:peptidoglycan glycosyltransferase n=1 Tax=Falsiroseomonas selenitidurans TaxID=2716335 RepID=A0ABX1E2I3_9PROT|nr:penicillin-binding protein 1C [Falsiroseomonas selenitidurans]NKC30973.1 penicillin-binding protein 1C [Falsiroseomonas selenitidurans]
MRGATPPARRWRRVLLGALLALPLGLFALDRALPPDLSRLHPGIEILDREDRLLATLPAPGGVWRLRTTVAEVPPHLVAMLLAAEDARFRWHPGVDPLALARAGWQWLRAGRVVSGGSTLTMQVARLLAPRPRTLRSKAIEILRALQLEARLGKEEILGIWLTLAPQGGNLEGIKAGALAWFGRPPGQLDAAEAALLVALARRPEALRPDRHPAAAQAARDALLRQRAPGAGGVTAPERALALASPVPRARHPMPNLAPHLARQVARGAAPGARLATTLDRDLQRAMEALAAQRLAALPDQAAMALLVAETGSREIRALVGGSFGVEARAGMLDLTQAVRSPGSAQKPFLYAMAFQAGLARPETLLADLPLRFGDYAPENFARDFLGRVTAAEALRQSLNLPAVALLSELGALRYAAALKAAGSPPRLAQGAEPSLPLALGGAGTTLRELVALYALLGDAGRAAPLVAQPGPVAARAVVLRARPAAEVAGILVNPFPGGGPSGVAWKTGTSWGGRDAWALGLDARHVAGVWVGRPDGTPLPGLTGRAATLPVLAAVFARLPAAPRPALRVRPAARPFAQPADRLRLLFPMPGAELADAAGPVTLRAAGGRRPLLFLVDGAPLPHQRARREAAWIPPGPGFYRVTVLDADGIAAAAELRVR